MYMYDFYLFEWLKFLSNEEKFCYIVNYFIWMWFVDYDGKLDLNNKINISIDILFIFWFEY